MSNDVYWLLRWRQFEKNDHKKLSSFAIPKQRSLPRYFESESVDVAIITTPGVLKYFEIFSILKHDKFGSPFGLSNSWSICGFSREFLLKNAVSIRRSHLFCSNAFSRMVHYDRPMMGPCRFYRFHTVDSRSIWTHCQCLFERSKGSVRSLFKSLINALTCRLKNCQQESELTGASLVRRDNRHSQWHTDSASDNFVPMWRMWLCLIRVRGHKLEIILVPLNWMS